jgi:O-methyltransferase
MTRVIDPDDLSIGYEIWARSGLDIRGLLDEMRAGAHALEADPAWRAFNRIWELVRASSLLGEMKAYVIYKLACDTAALPGDVIELGVYRGGLSFMLGLLYETIGSTKKVLMCDAFDAGLPEPDRRVDRAYTAASMACSVVEILAFRSKLELDARCVVHRGLFADTLPQLPANQRFSFAHVDCDLYAGARDGLRYVYPRLVDGGVVVADDYYDESHGVMTALNELAAETSIVIHLSVFGQAYFVKGEASADYKRVTIGPHTIKLATDAIRREPIFLAFLHRVLERKQQSLDRLRAFLALCEGEARKR